MKITVGKIFSGIIGGFGFMFVASILVATVFNRIDPSELYRYVMPITWLSGIIIAITAPTTAKSWRRLFIVSGIICLSWPVAIFLFHGVLHSNSTSGFVAGTVASWIMAVPSFFFGIVLLVIGLLIGRDKVVYMIAAPTPPH